MCVRVTHGIIRGVHRAERPAVCPTTHKHGATKGGHGPTMLVAGIVNNVGNIRTVNLHVVIYTYLGTYL